MTINYQIMNSKTLSLITFLLLVVFTTSLVEAQPKAVGEPEVLVSSNGTPFMKPLWSPDGTSLAFTSIRHQGIWVADASGNQVEQITDKNAGYGFSWSTDGTSLLTRVSEYQNRRQKHAISIFSLADKNQQQITDFRDEMPATPQWADFDRQVVLITDKSVESFDTGKQLDSQQKMTTNKLFYVLKSNKLAAGMVPTNSTEDISPFEDAQYLNLEVSPDGQKLSFEIYGGNLFVMNIDGTGLVDLGKANRAKWSPDSQYVIAMIADDNGYEYTRSDIVALSVDGSQRVNLTESTDLLATNPDWSPTGNKIAFDNPKDGNIYVLSIEY